MGFPTTASQVQGKTQRNKISKLKEHWVFKIVLISDYKKNTEYQKADYQKRILDENTRLNSNIFLTDFKIPDQIQDAD